MDRLNLGIAETGVEQTKGVYGGRFLTAPRV